MVKVAIITTSWEDLGGTGKKTGLWYEELAAPFFYFTDKVSCAFSFVSVVVLVLGLRSICSRVESEDEV